MSMFMQILKTSLEPIILLLLRTARQIADMIVKGDQLPVWGLKVLVLAYAAGRLFKSDIVQDDENTWHDDAVDELLEFIKNQAAEAGVTVMEPPVIEEPQE